MGKRGPAPKPMALKVLEGTYRSDRDSGADFSFSNKLPTCPGFLSKEAKGEWRRLVKELHSIGLLKTVDRAALAAYCDAYGRWVESVNELAKEDVVLVLETSKGYQYQNPWLSIARTARDDMIRIGSLFGLNPSARNRVKLPDPDGNQPSLFDEINALMESAAEKSGIRTEVTE